MTTSKSQTHERLGRKTGQTGPAVKAMLEERIERHVVDGAASRVRSL